MCQKIPLLGGTILGDVYQIISGKEKVIAKGQYYVDEHAKRNNTVLGAAISTFFRDFDADLNQSIEQRKSSNISLVTQLGSQGWEPTTFDDQGLIIALKRVKPNPVTDKPSSELNIEDLLIQLSNLRNKGILTQEEFEAKKSELLKRL